MGQRGCGKPGPRRYPGLRVFQQVRSRRNPFKRNMHIWRMRKEQEKGGQVDNRGCNWKGSLSAEQREGGRGRRPGDGRRTGKKGLFGRRRQEGVWRPWRGEIQEFTGKQDQEEVFGEHG